MPAWTARLQSAASDRSTPGQSPPVDRSNAAPPRRVRLRRPGLRRPAMLRSAGFRMAAIYAALFSISAFLFLGFLWWATSGLLERQVEAAIRADAEILSEHWLEGGLASLVMNIHERLDQDVDKAAIYLLEDPAGNRLAGNIETWPAPITTTGIWYELPITRDGTHGIAEMRAFQLPGGDRLLIGRDIRGRDMLRRLLGQTLIYSLALALALSAFGVVIVRNLFHRMVSNVSGTASRIAAGALHERVPLIGTGDEFDQVAETINDMLDRIARLMDGVRQVSNSIAHDLRTPITRARGLLEDAIAVERPPEELRAAIEGAVENLDGITKVFEALLRIAEIEAGSRRSAFATFDLVPLLDNLAEFYTALAEEGGAGIATDAPPSLVIHGDRALLQQAIANLLDNAIKFSPRGGTVRLHAALDQGRATITVADEGPGMPPADLARATERFFRGETARSTPGSGLGLALVQAVVQLHGGELHLEDADPGLSARITLPVPGRAA